MKEYFIEFFKLLASCLMIVCFAFVSFLIIINFYHYNEVDNAYAVNFDNNNVYKEYQKLMKDVDKKFNSKAAKNANDDVVNVVLRDYKLCKDELDKGSFNKINNGQFIRAKDIYDFNYEMINSYNKKCIFGIAYDIHSLKGKSFDSVYNKVNEKKNLLLDSSNSLVKSQLGNSSYSFTTYITRATIYDKIGEDFKVTVDNYEIMASILDDIANWYVSEYGGGNYE